MERIHQLLLQAIEGESGAEAGYKKYAERAVAEGMPKVAALFESLSRAEAIHIANHRRALLKNGYVEEIVFIKKEVEVLSTQENLKNAIRAEYDEFKDMYPSFRKQIQKSYGNSFNAKVALLSIKWAAESEKQHHRLLGQALESVAAGRDMSGSDYYLCSVCGNVDFLVASPTEPCVICGHDISFYSIVEQKK